MSRTDRPGIGPDTLVLCSGTLGSTRWPDKVRAAGGAGFGAISVYVHEYEAARAAGWSDADLHELLAEGCLSVAEVDGAMSWLPGTTTALAGRRRPNPPEDFVAVAAALGARSLTVIELSGEPVASGVGIEAAAGAFAEVCDLAAEAGLLAHIEPFPWSGIADLVTADRIARAAGRPNGGLLLDTWHLQRGRDRGRIAPSVDGRTVLSVQVSDVAAQAGPSVAAECMHERLLPGAGVGGVAPLLAELRRRGCDAPLGAEVFSDALHALPAHEAAGLVVEALRAVCPR